MQKRGCSFLYQVNVTTSSSHAACLPLLLALSIQVLFAIYSSGNSRILRKVAAAARPWHLSSFSALKCSGECPPNTTPEVRVKTAQPLRMAQQGAPSCPTQAAKCLGLAPDGQGRDMEGYKQPAFSQLLPTVLNISIPLFPTVTSFFILSLLPTPTCGSV